MRLRACLVLLTALLTGVGPLLAAGAAAQETGPDVSRYQHPAGRVIDWQQVRASGQDFTWVKATEGTGVRNAWYGTDAAAARAAGLYVGAYHYARPSTASGSAAAQARRFAAAIGDQTRPGTLPPALDLETSGGLSRGQLVAWTRSFLVALEDLTGRRPVLYTYPSFWKDALGGTSAFAAYPLWIAHYTRAAAPTHPGWPAWTFWQYSATSRVAGISGDTDMNRFAGSAADLARLALAAPPDAPVVEVPTGPSPSAVAAAAPGRYVATTPDRVVDTRTGLGSPRGRVDGALTVTLPPDVPLDAAGVVLNVSAVEPRAAGSVQATRPGEAAGTTALSYGPRGSSTALVVVRPDASRQVRLQVQGGSPHLVVDVVGHYDARPGSGGSWVPLPPSRVLDSRSGLGTPRGARTGEVPVALPASVPAGARGVVLNVSLGDAASDAFLRVAPAGAVARTTALNVPRGRSLTGLVLTPVGPGGALVLQVNGGPASVVVDLVGYYDDAPTAGSAYVGSGPSRLVDTRTGGGGRTVQVPLPATVPADAAAVLLSVSTTSPAGDGYLRVAPQGRPAATTALTYTRGVPQTGLVLVQPDGARTLTLTMAGGVSDVVVDLVGHQAAGPA